MQRQDVATTEHDALRRDGKLEECREMYSYCGTQCPTLLGLTMVMKREFNLKKK